nr:hypothetical protein [Tanacetum cinerariifolium]
MSILRGRKSVPGISSRERGNGKKRPLCLHVDSRKLLDRVSSSKRKDFHLYYEYFRVTRMFWQVLKENA